MHLLVLDMHASENRLIGAFRSSIGDAPSSLPNRRETRNADHQRQSDEWLGIFGPRERRGRQAPPVRDDRRDHREKKARAKSCNCAFFDGGVDFPITLKSSSERPQERRHRFGE
jgi:hypothetical protein